MIPTLIKNPNAIMQSITGDGVTTVIELQEYEVSTQADDVIIVRKETSDGSFINDPKVTIHPLVEDPVYNPLQV